MIQITEDLKKYIREAFKSGMTEKEVKKTLSSGSFKKQDIEKAFSETDGIADCIRESKEKNSKKKIKLPGFFKR